MHEKQSMDSVRYYLVWWGVWKAGKVRYLRQSSKLHGLAWKDDWSGRKESRKIDEYISEFKFNYMIHTAFFKVKAVFSNSLGRKHDSHPPFPPSVSTLSRPFLFKLSLMKKWRLLLQNGGLENCNCDATTCNGFLRTQKFILCMYISKPVPYMGVDQTVGQIPPYF